MSNPLLDREGNFRIQIQKTYALKEFKSGAVCIGLIATVLEKWNEDDEAWEDWRQYFVDVPGDIFIINKKGELMEKNIQSLVANAGWDGDFNSIPALRWNPTPCQCSVSEEQYNGNTSFKIAFINPFDSTPGSGGMSAEKVVDLANRFGSQLRALTGNVKRNAAPPADKPTPPKKQAPATMAATKAVATDGDEPPF